MMHRAAVPSHRPANCPAQATLDALEDIAGGGLAERARIDSAARILVLARRAAELAARGLLSRSETPVDRIAGAWDPSVMTASEYAELLTPAERDRLIAAAPGWAASQLAVETRRAA